MVTLVRYLLSEHLKILGLCFSGLFLIYLGIDFFNKIRRFIRYDADTIAVFGFFILRIPQMLMDITPVAVLMAVLLTLGMLSRHNEIVAMKSSGISTARLAIPFLIVSLLISTLLLIMNLSIVPLSKQRGDYVRELLIEKRPPDIYFRQSRIWMIVGQRAFMNIKVIDGRSATLHGVALYRLDDHFSLAELLEADRIGYEQGEWILYKGVRRTFLPDGRITIERLDHAVISLNRKPEEFMRIEQDTDKMTYVQLYRYVLRLEQEGYDAERYRVDLHYKTALPFTAFILGLIGIPLGLGRILGRGISRGIGLSLVIALVYFILNSLSVSLGHGGVLPPFWSAWVTNLMFALIGVGLMRLSR
jgi:lipopolysaccharide export system permease protein